MLISSSDIVCDYICVQFGPDLRHIAQKLQWRERLGRGFMFKQDINIAGLARFQLNAVKQICMVRFEIPVDETAGDELWRRVQHDGDEIRRQILMAQDHEEFPVFHEIADEFVMKTTGEIAGVIASNSKSKGILCSLRNPKKV